MRLSHFSVVARPGPPADADDVVIRKGLAAELFQTNRGLIVEKLFIDDQAASAGWARLSGRLITFAELQRTAARGGGWLQAAPATPRVRAQRLAAMAEVETAPAV